MKTAKALSGNLNLQHSGQALLWKMASAPGDFCKWVEIWTARKKWSGADHYRVQPQAAKGGWELLPSDRNLGTIINELFLSRSLRIDDCVTKTSFPWWIKWIDDGNPNRKRVRGELYWELHKPLSAGIDPLVVRVVGEVWTALELSVYWIFNLTFYQHLVLFKNERCES